MYKDIENFKKDLIEKIPFSCKENNITETLQKEIMSINRLKIFCENNNIIYKRNDTNGNSIDGYINDYKIQNKYISYPGKNKICYTNVVVRYLKKPNTLFREVLIRL